MGRRRMGLVKLLAAATTCVALGAAVWAQPAGAQESPEWDYVVQVAQQLREQPPQGPLVLLLGGSCAREALVSNASWAEDVQKLTGSPVVTYNLGSKNQSFQQDVALVKALPKVPALIFIGINRGRFTPGLRSSISTTPPPTKPVFYQHHYRKSQEWSLERKQEEVRFWMDERYPVFKARFADNLKQFGALIVACKQRGYYPVVLDLPRNTSVIGHAFDEPDAQFLTASRKLVARHGVPFVDFVAEAGLVNDDFYDLDHLLETGRPKFQRLLAGETARLLASEPVLKNAGGQTSSTASASILSDVRSHLWEVLIVVALVVVGGGLVLQRRRVVMRRRRRAAKRPRYDAGGR
jgi:hypothetical protein